MFCQKYIVWYFVTWLFLCFLLEHSFQASFKWNLDRASNTGHNIRLAKRADGGDNDPDAISPTNPLRIDVHHHIIPEIYATALAAAGGDPAHGPTPPWSVSEDLQAMAELGIEKAIVSITSPGTKIYEGDVSQGRTFARQLNEYSAQLCANYSGKFGFFASLPPLTDVDGALIEIDYVESTLNHHAYGYTLYTSYGPNFAYLGNSSFHPVWAKLDELSTTVFIHPSLAPTTVTDQYLPQPVIDYPQETTRTASDLVLTGTRAMFPNVNIILPHAGGTLPYLGNRVTLVTFAPQLQVPRTSAQILKDFQSFCYDTALSEDDPQLDALLAFANSSKILFGTDFPYAPFPAIINYTDALDTYFLSNGNHQDEKTWEDINNKNAKSLLQKL